MNGTSSHDFLIFRMEERHFAPNRGHPALDWASGTPLPLEVGNLFHGSFRLGIEDNFCRVVQLVHEQFVGPLAFRQRQGVAQHLLGLDATPQRG